MDNFNHPSKLKLKIAYWYVIHKTLLKKAGFFVLLVAFLGFTGFGAYGFIADYISSSEHDEVIASLVKNQINYKIFQIKVQPRPLNVKNVDVIKTDSGKFDFLAEVENPNEKWLIEKISYQFVSSDFKTPVYEDFILPGGKKYLLALSQESGVNSAQADLKIIDIKQVRTRGSFEVMNNDLLIEDIKFFPAGSEKISLPRVKFKVTNNSAYDFWEAPFQIILFNRAIPIGVNVASLTEFRSGETREIEVVWFDDISFSVTEVFVGPDVNFFDKENYMPPGMEVGELK